MSRIVLILAGVLLIAAVACGSEEEQPTATPTTEATIGPGATEIAGTQPTATIAPDTIVARVNGEEITQGEFDMRFAQASDSYAQQGASVDSAEFHSSLSEVLVDRMVDEVLVRQAAEEMGTTADESEIDSRFDEVAGQFESPDQFEEALSQSHLDAEQLRENIENSIVMDEYVNNYVENNVPDSALEPTDEELQSAYEQYISQLQGDIPPLEEVRDQIAPQIRQQKQQQEIADHLDELEAEAEVEILI